MKKFSINPAHIDMAFIQEAAEVIVRGGIVAFPTETVYGLAGRADNQAAVERLYAIKNRSKDKPFALALADIDKVIYEYFDVLPPFGYRLIERFWPGPLTLVYFTPADAIVGIRIPSHAIARRILQEANVPVCLPSANKSGSPETLTATEVERAFDDAVDLIVDGGSCEYARASTVVDLVTKPFKILREGVIPREEIVNTFIRKRILFVCTGNSCRSPLAQFLLQSKLSVAKPYLDNRYEIVSAGISAPSGSGAAPSVVSMLKQRRGIDASAFRARRLERQMILASDLIFTMEDVQKNYVIQYEPTAEGKVFTIKKFLPATVEQDIPDPIGKSEAFYEEVYALLEKAVDEIITWL